MIGQTKSKYLHANSCMILMAVCLGGSGIWCMHLIGMSAMRFVGIDGNVIAVRLDIGMTVLALATALSVAAAGLYVGSLDSVFTKHKHDIVEMFMKAASGLSLDKASHMNHQDIVCLVATRAPLHLVGGGLIAGCGIVVSFYVGMAAMRFPGHIVWDFGIVAASILIAFAASTAAFWILFRLLSLYANRESLRIACALTMACAVCGMHYTGIVAATFELDEAATAVATTGTMSVDTALLASLLVSAAIVVACLTACLADLRYSVHKLSEDVYKADDFIVHLDVAPNSHGALSVARYVAKRKSEGVALSALHDRSTIHQVVAEERLPPSTGAGHSDRSVLNRVQKTAQLVLHVQSARVYPSTGSNNTNCTEPSVDSESGRAMQYASSENA
jgi:NO-binding membrane sensor protein with MHYT domain